MGIPSANYWAPGGGAPEEVSGVDAGPVTAFPPEGPLPRRPRAARIQPTAATITRIRIAMMYGMRSAAGTLDVLVFDVEPGGTMVEFWTKSTYTVRSSPETVHVPLAGLEVYPFTGATVKGYDPFAKCTASEGPDAADMLPSTIRLHAGPLGRAFSMNVTMKVHIEKTSATVRENPSRATSPAP